MDQLGEKAEILELDEECKKAVYELANKTAHPTDVTKQIEQFCNSHSDKPEHLSRLAKMLATEVYRKRLVFAFGNSPFLSQLIQKWPEFLEEPTKENPLVPSKEQLVDKILSSAFSRKEADCIIRLTKQRAYLGIGMRDLTKEATLLETVQSLSDLAESCLEAAYQWLDRWLSKQYGHPIISVPDQPDRPAKFTILGMGKLGGRELNFSSDIDLIYLYDDDSGMTDGSRSIPIKKYYSLLGRELIQFLGKSTAEGRAFRVDLRLRPEGESGDLAISTRSAEVYYESWGQTWERSAMIKARPVAGDIAVGEEFLKNIRPFVFRRFLDFAALDAIREMKRKIDRKLTAAQDYQRNVKLGYGGIREIEFFVQCQQLIHGGKIVELRNKETLVILQRLVEHDLLDRENATFLTEAYEFLRVVEHRLQIEWEKQTHSLPEDPGKFERVAKRAGFTTAKELKDKLTYYTDGVQKIYSNLFFDGEQNTSLAPDNNLTTLLNCNLESESARECLQKAGFQNLEHTKKLINILNEGPRGMALTEHDRQWYEKITVPLLGEILHAPDQDLALQHSESFLSRLGHRVSYLAMLVENPAILKLLVKLFGTSPLLSRFLIQHPELMDRLSFAGFFTKTVNKGELTSSLKELLQQSEDQESRFNSLREFKNTESLRLGIGDLSGTVELQEVMSGLSNLADVVLTQVLHDAWQELAQRHGNPFWEDEKGIHQAPFAIIAMGKLGGGELNYSSDLDLIFIHGGSGDNQMTDGSKPISNTIFFSRLGQRVITAISVMTESGKLYELDMRLRPSGQSGPLVTSLDSFINYQKKDAWVWEHQALTRARAVAGNHEFIQELNYTIKNIICQSRDINNLRKEVVEMRERMYKEKQPAKDYIDIKQSRGGIVDVEFLVQFLILAHAANTQKILQKNASKAIHSFRLTGLLDGDDCTVLEEAYYFYRLVENRLRLLHDQSINSIGPDIRVQRQLQRLCGLSEDENIISAINSRFAAVYPIYNKILKPDS
ncbi:MAG: bifunctional [glutamate--ammonia ligase]-adenylyl-L-tyrosine phosphorylase/[glutamate--ammonia-ligase] adenylyltransferase [Magnetococcales bacterium]|nr:bifunctional [glutamate--ammonia ligase]-adenylyl-L-tyrosine phosphorylase/[glutamate--ammonia-ligase] adenylyltransferase [Magnetococcales bacterium]